MTRAKFLCQSIKESVGSRRKPGVTNEYEPALMISVEMYPVYANGNPNHENSKFWDASPGGKLELNVINPDAAAIFEPGKEYYVDFTRAA